MKNISFNMPKGDPGSLQTLKNYIHNFTGMGDFLIHNKRAKLGKILSDLVEKWIKIYKSRE